MTAEKQYDGVSYSIDDALYYRFNFFLSFLQLAVVISVRAAHQKPSEANKARVESPLFTCIKALEVIRRTTAYEEALESAFDKANIVGIAIDVQVRTQDFPSFDKTVEGIKNTLEAMLGNYELASVASALDLMQKWDRLNSRDNNFLVSSHVVTTAFDESNETYFKKIELKDFIVDELKHYKYDWVAKIENAKKNKETNLDDVNAYLDCFKGLRSILVTMATNRSALFTLLEKFVDFLYFVHIGVVLPSSDQTPRQGRPHFQRPLHVPHGDRLVDAL